LARRHHPDAGGDPAEFKRLRQAYEQALAHLEQVRA
jgi:curved DNA-binding protein CbpA